MQWEKKIFNHQYLLNYSFSKKEGIFKKKKKVCCKVKRYATSSIKKGRFAGAR